MTVHLVTGRLGAGKSLVSVGRIWDYLAAGRPVATNLDIYPAYAPQPWLRDCVLYRLPDYPSVADLEALGIVDTNSDESKNGLIVLDECSHHMNSRDWQHSERAAVLRWLTHARKLGWDVIMIVQHPSMMDKQIREALSELVVTCKRLDRFTVPLIGPLLTWLLGVRINLPRVHVGIVKYGLAPTAQTVERWVYRGTSLFKSFDTRQIFGASEVGGLACVLTPWHARGRYTTESRYLYEQFKNYAIDWKKTITSIRPLPFFFLGLVVGYQAVGNSQPTVTDEPHAVVEPIGAPTNNLASLVFDGSVCVAGDCDYYFSRNGEPVDIRQMQIFPDGNPRLLCESPGICIEF